MRPFHLAFPVSDLYKTVKFYNEFLGCEIGRTNKKWIDFNFFDHQITAHLKPEECFDAKTNTVDGDQVPVKHFGVILEWKNWKSLVDMITASSYKFSIEPKIRFEGEVGEQGTFFINDPSGNALEFKTFKNEEKIFKSTGW